MTCGIYSITSPSGNCYIGSSVHIEKRKQQHFRALRHKCHHAENLQRAFNKYGVQALAFTIVETCAASELLNVEQQYLNAYKPRYNSSLNAYSPLKDPRIQEKHKAAVNTEEYKQAMRQVSLRTNTKARFHTPEAIAKAIATKRTALYRQDASKRAKAANIYLQTRTPKALAKHREVMRSATHRKKASDIREHLKKPVLDLNTGVHYESTHAAAKATLSEHANIGRAARTGTRAAGHYWVFTNIDIVI